MSQAVPRWRTLPFNEHRSMAEVVETEALERQYAMGKQRGAIAARLYALQSRAIYPTPRDEPPPPAA